MDMEGRNHPRTLLTLPLELRQMIYDYAFQNQIVDVNAPKSTNTARHAGLLLACHQTHTEAIKTYYTRSIFFTSSARQLGWLDTIPFEYRHWIQELRCTIDLCQEDIVYWSTAPNVITRYLWRKFFRDRFIIKRLAKRGIVMRSDVLKVNVECMNGTVVWSAEPENFVPLEYEEVFEDEEEWEIEEMAR